MDIRDGLIEELKKEHTEIIDTLLRVKAMDITTEHGQEALLSAKDMLLSHIKKEDDELYPVLRKIAGDDEARKKTAEALEAEMKEIADEAFDFFEKYTKETLAVNNSGKQKRGIGRFFKMFSGKEKIDDFIIDFERLYSILLSRIRKEDEILNTVFKVTEE
jgi:hypothetical protein